MRRLLLALLLLLWALPACEKPAPNTPSDAQTDSDTDTDTAMADADAGNCPTERDESGICPRRAPRGAEDCSTETTQHDAFSGDGTCLPTPPTGSPTGTCPSGEFFADTETDWAGICEPERPNLPDWDCTDPWQAAPLLADSTSPEAAVQTCRPPDLPAECDPGEWLSLRDGGCVRQGPECPQADDWAPDADIRAAAPGFDGDIIFVGATASNQAGTRSEPYTDLPAALQQAQDGDILALSASRFTFQRGLEIDKRLAVVGACASQTSIAPPDWLQPTVTLTSPDGAHFANLRIEGQPEDPTVELTMGAGEYIFDNIRIQGGSFETTSTDPQAKLTMSSVVTEDRGDLDLRGPGQLSINGGWLAGGYRDAVYLSDELEAQVENVVIQGHRGREIDANFAADVTIKDVLVRSKGDSALVSGGADTRMTVEDVYIVGMETPQERIDGLVALHGGQISAKRITVDAGPDGAVRTGLVAEGGTADVEQLAVVSPFSTRDENTSGVFARALGSATVDQAVIASGGLATAGVHRGSLTLTDILGTTPEGSASPEMGMFADEGTIEVQRVALDAWQRVGVEAQFDGIVEGLDLSIRSPRQPDTSLESLHRGLVALDGGVATLTRTSIDGAGPQGVYAEEGGRTRLDDVIVTNLVPLSAGSDQTPTAGALWSQGGIIDVQQLAVDEAAGAGIVAVGDSGTMTLRNGLVTDVASNLQSGTAGYGVYHNGGIRLDIEGLELQRTTSAGILVANNDFVADIHELTIRDVRAGTSEALPGVGVAALNGRIVGTRWHIDQSRAAGLLLRGQRTNVNVSDLNLTDSQGTEDGRAGGGLFLEGNARFEGTRVSIQRARGFGVLAQGTASVKLEDAVLADTLGRASDNAFGVGLGLSGASSAELQRVAFVDNRAIGIALDDTTHLDATDLLVANTGAMTCDACDLAPGGAGIAALGSAGVLIERFDVEDNELVGIHAGESATLSLAEGRIANHPIGVNGPDAAASASEVEMTANDTDTANEALEIPELDELWQFWD